MQGFAINRMGGLGSGKWSPNRVFAGDAGFYGDPAMFGTMNTIWDGSGVAPTAAGDLIGLVNRIAGTFNVTQSVSGNRPQLAAFPKIGLKQLWEYPRAVANAAWTKTNCTPTDGQTSYDGTATATLLTVGTATNSGISQTMSGVFGVSRTCIVVVVAKNVSNARWLRLFASAATNPNAWFDLDNGVLGTVQANATAGMTSMGNGWYMCWNYSTGTIAPGIRIEDTDGVIGSPTAGAQMLVADPMTSLGTTVPTFQNNIGMYEVTQTGQPQIWLPRGNGTSTGLNGPTNFGLCTSGLYAAAGQNWTVPFVFRTLADGTIVAQRGAVDANAMFSLRVSSGTLRCRLRGTDNNTTWTVNAGEVHCGYVECANGVVTIYMDSQTPFVCTVGAAAAETTTITMGYHNIASPAGWLTGHFWTSFIDQNLSAANDAQWLAYNRARYQP